MSLDRLAKKPSDDRKLVEMESEEMIDQLRILR